MTTIQDIYDVSTPAEFETLITGLGWELYREDIYTMVRWTRTANIEVRPSLKGLIYETQTGVICAPGVPIPIEPENQGTAQVIGYSKALDGVMVRFWSGVTGLMWSTNGAITAGTWRDQGLTMHVLRMLESEEVDTEQLFKGCQAGLCYFAVLESPDLPNIYKAPEPRLTLVRVMDKSGTSLPLTPELCSPFKHVNYIESATTLHSCSHIRMNIDQLRYLVQSNCRDVVPVTPDSYGMIVHLDNGATFRVLSDQAKAAEQVRPNFRALWQHWIYNVRETDGPEDWKAPDSKMTLYKTFFPWNADAMDGMSAVFDFLVDQEEHGDVLKSNHKLCKFVAQYNNLVEKAGTYMRTENGTVCTQLFGDFPDDESAHHYIDWVLAKPARIVEAFRV